jgi:antitoxin CcdA
MRITLAHTAQPGGAEMDERQPRKRAVNLFVEVELLDEAKRLRINLSETLERRLRSLVRAEQEKRWLEQNRDALAAYNARVSSHGLLSDEAGLL